MTPAEIWRDWRIIQQGDEVRHYREFPGGRVCIIQSSKTKSDWLVKYRGSIVAEGVETGLDHIETAREKCLANKHWNTRKSFFTKGKK